MPQQILLIRQPSALRTISKDEAVQVLTDAEKGLVREDIEVPTAQFADAIAQGDWGGQDAYLREAAARIRAEADARGDVAVHYLGLAEVPHIVALGAHVGNERVVIPHDHMGEAGPWKWPEAAQTVKLKTVGDEELKVTVKARGPAVIRVSISATVTDDDVRAVVGEGMLADITITHAEAVPARNLVGSAADVDAVREKFIAAYGALLSARPGIDIIHLFVAAPPSVCFAVGQELVLRNGKPVQTYRYRAGGGDEPAQQTAILLSAAPDQAQLVPLTPQEIELAAHVRNNVWRAALREVEAYAANKEHDGHAQGAWYGSFVHRDAFCRACPFPTLPPLASFMPRDIEIDAESYANDFGFEETGRRWWRLNDRLLLGIRRAAGGNDERLRQLIRLFLFHEYVHLFHSIGKHTAEEVGKFANCLEHVDYTADTYALLHQLDLTRFTDPTLAQFQPMRAFLVDQIELAISSFWAFDADAGSEWQVRRIRRYLNWYWRQVQVENAQSADAIAALFTRQPRIEVGGLYQVARGRRVIAFLDKLDTSTHLELAIVMENEKLFRLSDSPNTNLRELLASFRKGEHQKIKQFFRAVYDTARGQGSAVQPALPAAPAAAR